MVKNQLCSLLMILLLGTGPGRVMRGGDWFHGANELHSAYRNYQTPASASGIVGFCCVKPE